MFVPVAPPGAARRQGPRKRVYLEQYGCATTEGEAAIMRGIVQSRGHALVSDLAEADTAVIVTCTVIDRTERAMLKRIAQLRESGKQVVVSGCMASSQVPRIKEIAPDALVLPPAYVHQVGELIERGVVEFCYQPKVGLPKAREGVLDTIVINEGCSGNCSFCITKIARPGLRSYPVDALVAEVQAAVDSGAREIRLTSQDAGAYGLDAGVSLASLVEAVTARVDGDYRLRIGMLNPWTLRAQLDDVLRAMGDARVFKFLHVPVQSGSDRMLRAMDRNHAASEVEAVVARVRDAFPDASILTDIVVGFPGETEADHRETLDLLTRLRPDGVNITRFSAREGTRAARNLSEGEWRPVPGSVVKRRSRELTALRFNLSRRINEAWVGREVSALVTEPGTREGTLLARTDEYRQIVVQGSPASLGERWMIKIEAARDAYLLGRRVAP